MAARFDERDAFAVVAFMDQYWRLAGNPGFNASIDRIRDRLLAAGFSLTPTALPATVRVDEFPNSGHGWDYRVGTLEFDGASESALLSRERDRVSLAINSFATPAEGVRAPLVDVGAGTESDYAGKTIKGAVVLGDAPLGRLWQEAVKRRGAAAPGSMTPELMQRAAGLGLVELTKSGTIRVHDRRFLETGSALAHLGVPLGVILDRVGEVLVTQTDEIAARFIALFEQHLAPDDWRTSLGSDEVRALAGTLAQLQSTARQVHAAALDESIARLGRERLGALVSGARPCATSCRRARAARRGRRPRRSPRGGDRRRCSNSRCALLVARRITMRPTSTSSVQATSSRSSSPNPPAARSPATTALWRSRSEAVVDRSSSTPGANAGRRS